MEMAVIFLQSVLVLLVVKHGTSVTSSCQCEYVRSFCATGITAVQGKVLGSKLVNQFGQSVSDKSNAHETMYQIQRTRFVINGSHSIAMKNDVFTISYPPRDSCEPDVKSNEGKELVFIGHVDLKGKFGKPVCHMSLRSRGEDNYEVLGSDASIRAVCKAIPKL